MDEKGYMVFKDVMNWEEIERPKPAKRIPAASAGVKSIVIKDGTINKA